MSSFLSFIIVLFILFNMSESTVCPSSYNSIFNGCYQMNNGTNMTWSDARQYCINDSSRIVINTTNYITHLVALESAAETTALIYWMKAWGIQGDFWTDGVDSSLSWDWSNQTITWYFNSIDQEIYGNGSNYLMEYNANYSTYIITDANNNKLLHFICEYQNICSTNNNCQNNGTCYLNVGQQLCVCAPGYTGTVCDQQIDECLSSPCQHGGSCTDSVDNYTCDCSNLFFHGRNCEIPNDDPTESQRYAAFWSVFGIVCGLVALLTLSDLPWDEIASTIGCPWFRFKCCSNNDDEDDDVDANNLNLTDSSVNGNNFLTMATTSAGGMNYHIMNTVWNPEHARNGTPSDPQYNGYQSPDQHTTPNNVLIQSFAAVVMAKHKEKQIDDKRVYAVDIIEDNNSTIKTKNPAETMISWTQQLQERLKPKQNRPISASSTKELIESEDQ